MYFIIHIDYFLSIFSRSYSATVISFFPPSLVAMSPEELNCLSTDGSMMSVGLVIAASPAWTGHHSTQSCWWQGKVTSLPAHFGGHHMNNSAN